MAGADARPDAEREVRRRLIDPALPDRLEELGFCGPDVVDLVGAASAVAQRSDAIVRIVRLAERLRDRIGNFSSSSPSPWVDSDPAGSDLAAGTLPLLALLLTAPDVRSFHLSRGVPPEVSAATLADLGRQAGVHRLTYRQFGLHTQGWLLVVWSGALYQLGRLQFNLQLVSRSGEPEEWVLSTHIPRGGPLEPDHVDAALTAATEFFARHFADYPTRDFFCESWILDPELPRLVPRSNLAAFHRRWRLYGDPLPDTTDLLFFLFDVRGQVDPVKLPKDTALRRAVVDRLVAGQGWSVRTGRLPQQRPEPPQAL